MKLDTVDKVPIDLIWNISLVCPWDCNFCCTDAVHVRSVEGGKIELRERGLDSRVIINTAPEIGSHLKDEGFRLNRYDYALIDRQRRGLELSYLEKRKVLENIQGSPVEIEFAGGDPLVCYENYLVIKYATELFGKDKISVTSTGATINRYDLFELANYVGQFEFTFDEVDEETQVRPKSYNRSNLRIAERMAAIGVRTKAQIPLHKGNMEQKKIRILLEELKGAGVVDILLMRVFPVGRAIGRQDKWSVSSLELRTAIGHYIDMSKRLGGVRIRLQCALRYLFPNGMNENPCDAIKSSFGINWKGQLLLSAWANSNEDGVLDDVFILGDLCTQTLSEIRTSPAVIRSEKQLEKNFGHCKVFSFLYSKKVGWDAIFDKADPLYVNDEEDNK
ncbi:MAG: radical SAM protein [Candidatus Thiodiazotropha endolucinida]|nr:radical SAM protein [Candidatus Thiodiazotropha taylori]MCW4342137.1 radical SAM protein [Candidatus Thiodiazotropha endolucinida]